MASARPSGLVPDRQAVLQQPEMPLLLPGTGLDFPQGGAGLHHLDVRVILDACVDTVTSGGLRISQSERIQTNHRIITGVEALT